MSYFKHQRKQVNKSIQNKEAQTEEKSDGWANLFTGLGTTKDPVRSNYFDGTSNNRGLEELEDAYMYDSLTRRIVDVVPQDMLSKGFKISGDTDSLLLKKHDKLQTKQKFTELLSWARLFGGSIIIIGINDGRPLEREVNYNNIKSVDWLHVFDKRNVFIRDENRYQDPTSKNYGEVELYEVMPEFGGANFYVHHSRVIRADGIKLPKRAEKMNEGWGGSLILNVWEELTNNGSTYGYVANIVKEFIQPILKMNNLANLMAQGKENLVKKRLDIIAMSKSILNMILIDEKEGFEKLSSTVSGLDKLLDAFDRKLSAATGIPLTRLMGISPGGLDSTGESDLTNYYDMVGGEQINKLTPMLTKLTDLILLSKESPIKLTEYTIEYNPLIVLDDKQKAQLRNLQSQTDQIYIQNNVVHPKECRYSRFSGEVYSTDTILDHSLDKELENQQIEKITDKSNLPGDADNSQKTSGNIAYAE